MKILNRTFDKKTIKLSIIICCVFVILSACFLLISGKKLLRRGELISFNNYSLYVRDYGKGGPAVIIEAGLDCTVDLYYTLQKRTSRKTRVIAYDHAGIGRSTPNSNPRTLPFYVEELRSLMHAKDIKPPYILIGHSLGGHIIRYYAYFHPEEVAGLVLIDGPHEDWFMYIKETWSREEIKEYFKFWDTDINSYGYEGVGLVEMSEYGANCDSVRGKSIPPDIPVLMFTGKNSRHFRKDSTGMEADMKAWADMQHSLIEKVKDANQIIDWETGHVLHNDKPDMVQQKVNDFIDFCRKKQKSIIPVEKR